MITVVGVKHTEALNKQLRRLILNVKPDVICVELDTFRCRLLRGEVSEEELRFYKGKLPCIYKVMSLFKYKSQVKSCVKREWDVETVLEAAEEINAEVIPIDMDQVLVYKKIEENIPLKEKVRLVLSLFRKLDFYEEHGREEYKEEFSKNFPTLKRWLIDERDRFMAEKIKRLSQEYE
ncbi:MAG TPA: hypothetical protein ENI42_03980, partial [Thermoplasmatales archaeon]|nr:hypothetical protein [Thermoplasmatales archaeon]